MRVMLENIHQQSMSIAQHLHTWLLIGQHVKSSGCFLVRRDYIWFCPRQLFKQINNYQTAALYLPHHKPLTWRRTILIWAHWIYSISPGDVPGSILVTVKCLSFFHRVFFFFSCEFPHWCCLVFIPCQKWKGDADREHKKGARTISNRSAPWVRAHVFLQGEPHALGVGNQSKHSCCCTDLFVCVCVCVCTYSHVRGVYSHV